MEYLRSDNANVIVKQAIGVIFENQKDVVNKEEWFELRYKKNPFGEAVIVCGVENGEVEACMVIEQFQLFCRGKVRHCGVVSELVTKKELALCDEVVDLMKVAEEEARKEGLDIIYAFKDLTELVKGIGDGWTIHQTDFQYRTLQTKPFRSLFRITDFEKPFVPEKIVYCGEGMHPMGQKETSFEVVSPVMSEAFLDWLFSINVGNKVEKLESEDIGIIGYVGRRGGIKEFHLLNLFPKEGESLSLLYQERVVESIIKSVNPDIISFEEGKNLLPEENTDYIKNNLKYGYKVLSEDNGDVEEMAVSINRWIRY